MKRIYVVMLALLILGVFLQSCDPVYSVRLKNLTNDTLLVVARTTIHFQSDTSKITVLEGPYDDEWIEFKVFPSTYVNCGIAIAGIQDEIPFTELKIYKESDSIIAKSEQEVLALFEKGSRGNLITPYEIRIE